jgi:choline-phosphate cytidylyltransferase
LTNLGHLRALEQARCTASAAAAAAGCGGVRVHLTVGLCTDADVAAYKGAAPILSAAERAESLRACRWVDAVLAAPWTPTPEFLDAHGLDVICHDDAPYPDASGAAADCYASVKAAGRFLPTQRTQGISTTDLLARVLKRRAELLAQCLARGVPPADLASEG